VSGMISIRRGTDRARLDAQLPLLADGLAQRPAAGRGAVRDLGQPASGQVRAGQWPAAAPERSCVPIWRTVTRGCARCAGTRFRAALTATSRPPLPHDRTPARRAVLVNGAQLAWSR
jgi:hypothetical protein